MDNQGDHFFSHHFPIENPSIFLEMAFPLNNVIKLEKIF